jgi:hypothetical protein
MNSMDEVTVTAELGVVFYSDGGREIRLSPSYGDPGTSKLLREAAATLTSSAGIYEAERVPMNCPTCGELSAGVLADPMGALVLLPCRHSVIDSPTG